MHHTLMEAVEGNDLIEKYESILRDYLGEYEPKLCSEITMRRIELKRYTDTLDEIQNLQQLVDDLKAGIEQFSEKSKEFIEIKVAECVIVQKSK